MGVMQCYRADCEEILCDRYSVDYGYICRVCFDEMESSNADPGEFMARPRPKRKPGFEIDYDAVFPRDPE